MFVNYCSIFGTYLVKFGNTDYRGRKLSSLEGGEADGKEVHPSVMLHRQGEGEVITQTHSILPNTAPHRSRVHAAAIFAHALQVPTSVLPLIAGKVSKHLLVTKDYCLSSAPLQE